MGVSLLLRFISFPFVATYYAVIENKDNNETEVHTPKKRIPRITITYGPPRSSKQPRDEILIKPPPPVLLPARRLVRHEFGFLTVDDVLTREQVRRQRRPAPGPSHQLVPSDHAEVEGDAQVSGEEVLVVELFAALAALDVHEDVEIFEDGDDDAEAESEVGAVEPKGRRVVHLRLVDALGAPGFDEVDVRDEDGDPGQEAEDGGQVDEIAKYLAGIVGHIEERDAGDDGREAERVDGDATAVGAREDAVGVAFLG